MNEIQKKTSTSKNHWSIAATLRFDQIPPGTKLLRDWLNLVCRASGLMDAKWVFLVACSMYSYIVLGNILLGHIIKTGLFNESMQIRSETGATLTWN